MKQKIVYVEMPQNNGGATFSLVQIGQDGKPDCKIHGAMNKVSTVFWRCISNAKTHQK